MRETSVYVIECQGYVKIGVANDAQSRLGTLQIGNPFPLKLLANAPFTDPYGTESYIHNHYLKYRVRGEWFHMPADVLNGLLELFLPAQPPPTPQRPQVEGPPPIKTWCAPDHTYSEAPDELQPDPEYWSRL